MSDEPGKNVMSGSSPLLPSLSRISGPSAAPPFEVLDTNKDGLINMEEAKGLKGLPVVFQYMDKNDSKMLEPEEYAYLRIGGEDNRRVTPESMQTK